MKYPIYILTVLCSAAILSGCGSSKTASEKPWSESGISDREKAALNADRQTVIRESRRWLGTPYQYGGNSRNGIDCSGFVTRVYHKVGIVLPRTARGMYEHGYPVSRKKIKPGDLVFFQHTAGRGITHVGIYLGREQFIHASRSKGVITSTLLDDYYNRHYAGARKILR